jgi:hypothetical protein
MSLSFLRITATGDKMSVLVMRREVYRTLQLQTGWDPANPMEWRFPAELLPWLENKIDQAAALTGAVTSNRSLAGLVDPTGDLGVSADSAIAVHSCQTIIGATDEYMAWAEANRTPDSVRRHG